ncbi:amidohydrolase [Gloeophyllum trabeum ATCC 11539]|uniref:Amidohydrolase n=1 Tax=Gloeophyllum trabeum (strain ATCC 11539 / FP-39264 / Madison 617) TaxID=670483 RepID=S7RTU7_GLOTA|nr:amidohydrolase [Gloeophyllum trabeum ATCC 11539]EPQ56574.1 amidohydrolase [Gloeophyllum trabeum ATCC 11539]
MTDMDVPGCFGGLLHPFRKILRPKPKWQEVQVPTAGEDTLQQPVDTKRADLQNGPAPHYLSCCEFGYGFDHDNLSILDQPPSYTPKERSAYRSDVSTTIDSIIDRLNPDLRELSLQIHDHPEIMFQEKYAHDTLTAFMADHGFAVTEHYLGLETAWKAEWSNGTGGRVLGINSEMDALPEIGHACGHNLIAIAGVGVALAIKHAMQKHDVSGKIVLLGTPAEEGGGGKVILLERGGYDEMDACLMCHPSPGPKCSAAISSSLSMQPIEVEYFGHPAHAAAFPWEGTNALDAAVLAYSAVSVLRQQMKPDYRVHGVIKGGDLAANVIPDYVKMVWGVRTPTKAELEVLRDRVKACLESAAVATGCRVKLTLGRPYYDLRMNNVLGREFENAMLQHNFQTMSDAGAARASTDFGNVSYALPSLHPHYAIPTEPNGGNHTAAFTASARTPEAHAATLTVAKGLAMTGFRVLDDADFYAQVKQDFDDMKAQ